MDNRQTSLHTILLLGTAFLAGVAVGPASDLIAGHFVHALGINTAFAQETDRADTYRLLACLGMYSNGYAANTLIRSPTRN